MNELPRWICFNSYNLRLVLRPVTPIIPTTDVNNSNSEGNGTTSIPVYFSPPLVLNDEWCGTPISLRSRTEIPNSRWLSQ